MFVKLKIIQHVSTSLIDDEEWEDMSDDDEDEVEMEVDERLEDISVAECVLDGKNQREIPLTECFFSGHISKTIDDNLKYMEGEIWAIII